MDDRVRKVEGDVLTLKDWRANRVDPWLKESADFHEEFRTYMDQSIARESEREKLQDERHHSNSFKLNLVAVLISIGILFLTLIGTLIAYAALKQSPHAFDDIINISNAPTLTLDKPSDAGLPPTYQPR